MNWNAHYNLSGKHAFLGASNYHWINYSEDKLIQVWKNMQAIEHGTKVHALAKQLIDLGVKLPKSRKTLNNYVNDAIGYGMKSEQLLVYSDNCFGTADAISFNKNVLRIHDLKTGATQASMKQLLVYAALFCLEYNYKPSDIDIILRIYQNDDVVEFLPTAEDIVPIMDKIITFDKIISSLKEA